jgi:hypothetical protein
MSCTTIITSGIDKDCATINAAIGVEKDLILVNYGDFDKKKTLELLNRETTGSNIKGLKNIFLKLGAGRHIFEGTEFSVIPSIIPEVKEDGSGTWYQHQILFTVYSKKAKARKTIEALAGSRVIGITVDRSTGLYELFGMDIGLRVSGIERPYTGAQNSNFYTVTMVTPEIDVIKESGLGELSALLTTNLV